MKGDPLGNILVQDAIRQAANSQANAAAIGQPDAQLSAW